MIDKDQDAQQMALPHLDLPLGLRLRQGREAAGMTVADAAERMRLKLAIVDAMEREDLKALGASVYVRGYYTSYARMLGLPLVLVDAGLKRETLPVAPTLHTTTRVSHGRYLFDRYARRAVYVVLTASIVLPVILLATRDHLPDRNVLLSPIDAPIALPEATRLASQDAPPLVEADGTLAGPPAPVDAEQPAPGTRDRAVMASLTPFYSPTREQDDAPAAVESVIESQAGALNLEFSGDSWVEVIGHDGARLAYGLMRDGESRKFDRAAVARVSLGNSGAVKVRMNGEVMDIAPYRRANVARFTVSSDGSLAPAGG